MIMRRLFLPILCSWGFAVSAQVTVVDVIPSAQSGESEQNSEPNIAVNPLNPNQIFITAFGETSRSNPIFFTETGGSSWSRYQRIATSDSTVSWSDSGKPYLAKLSISGNTLIVQKASNIAARRPFLPMYPSFYSPGFGGPDQPWVFANLGADDDHIFVGFNDLSRPSRTASIRFSLNHGRTWRNVVIERVTPGDFSDGAPVRVAARGSVVYAVFQRFDAAVNNGDERGDVVVVKDTNSGRNNFRDLGGDGVGVVVATAQVFPQGSIGQERLGSDLSIAIDPTNANRVFIAYDAVVSGLPVIKVALSTNGGASWSTVYQS
ncbi:MAG: hypothetical protein QOD99_112, partial [Chthoniobacter sp.]|nr:hypothetical protein [Chthoniobacter sp.]